MSDTQGHILLLVEAKCLAQRDWDAEHVLGLELENYLPLPSSSQKSAIHCGSD